MMNAKDEMKLTLDMLQGVFDGGPGSGNFGHAGRPGEVGGSAPASGGTFTSGDVTRKFYTENGKYYIQSTVNSVHTTAEPEQYEQSLWEEELEEAKAEAAGGTESEWPDGDISEEEITELHMLDDVTSGNWWGRRSDLEEELEDAGFTIEESNDEYIDISSDLEHEYSLVLGGTPSTIIVKKTEYLR